MLVFKKDGSLIRLGERVGSGGEGTIYRTQEGCAKLYRSPEIASENLPKVIRLQSIYWQNVQRKEYQRVFERVLIPRDILFDRMGRFVGFLMPCLPKDGTIVLIDYLSHNHMKTLTHPWDMPTRAKIVGDIVGYVLLLHRLSVLPIDLNDQNIFIRFTGSRADVFFIDTDSYQVERIPARVIAGDIAPPEFFSGIHLASERSMVYVLAVIVHRIIMDGFSPFQFIRRTDISPFEIKKKGYSPLRISSLKPPRGYPPMRRLGALKDVIAAAISPNIYERPELSTFYAVVDKWITTVDNL